MFFGVSDFSLAEWSNWFVYASMIVWTLAFFSFAVSFATVRASKPSNRAAKALATVGAGSTQVRHTPVDELPRGRRSGNIGMSLTWLATVLLGLSVAFRGLSVHRWPLGNMYEYSLAAGFLLALTYLILSIKNDLQWLGVLVSSFVLLDLGLAITVLYTESAPLVPALRSYWLVIHVSAAVISGGAFSVAAGLTMAYLFKERMERLGKDSFIAEKLPSADRLDLLAYRVHAFIFPVWTFAVIAGAIWAEAAWSRYWGWDPKETWAFITWLCYAAYLHARVTVGWKGRKAAAISLVAFSTFLFNYFAVNLLFAGLHSYAGV